MTGGSPKDQTPAGGRRFSHQGERACWDGAMGLESANWDAPAAGPALHVYLLGLVDFEAALRVQRHLVYHVSGERDEGALVLCEHPPLITVGRQGSHAHILY